MNDLETNVFPILQSGGAVVLPTEESARAVAIAYVKSTGRGLLASKCLSFDTFASLFIPCSEELRAADDLDRLLFAESFADTKSDSLSYLYNKDYPELKNSLPSFIKKMLPSLNEAFSKEIGNKDLYSDLSLLMNDYKEFLNCNGLYEAGWAEYEDRELSEDYYLYHSEAFPKEKKLLDKVGSNPRIHEIACIKEIGELLVYKNEAQEIRALFQKIRELIDKDVPLNRIAVSTSALDRIRPYLELESKLFDVPVYFVPGVKAVNTPPGHFLKTLGDLYNKDYEINLMKKLFLDPSFAFQEKETIYEFIAKAVALSVKNAPKGKIDRYSKIGAVFYKDFRRALDSLMEETKPSKVLFRYERLMELLFADERFINTESNDKIYGFIADALAGFILKACSLELSIERPVFPMFLTYLDSLVYVDREKNDGIHIYPFTQAAATPYDYHFLITLNEDESSQRIREASFLTEYEREAFAADDRDITDALIASYQGVSENLYYSSSEDTYSGYKLPLVALMNNIKRRDGIPLDPYQREASSNRADIIYPLQKEGFERAEISAMRKISKKLEIQGLEDRHPHLSFTKISEYNKCPYRYALKYCYGLNSEQPYEIMLIDHLEIGTRLHSILERFFAHQETSPDRIKFYFRKEIEAWKNGQRFNKDDSLKAMEFGSASATEELALYVESHFLDNLINAADKILKLSNPIADGNEVELRSDRPDYSLTGYADMIADSLSDNQLIIYDFKKGNSFKKGELEEKKLQFSIYRMLIEDSDRFSDKKVGEGIFVTLSDDGFNIAWSDGIDGTEEICRKEEEMIENTATEISKGNWSMSDDNAECSGCSYKAICRRKFVIQ